MASPADVTQALPEILPDDFGDWDSAAAPAIISGDPGAFEAGTQFGVVSKPFARPVAEEATVTPPLDGRRDATPPPQAVLADDRIPFQRSTGTTPDRFPGSTLQPRELRAASERSLTSPRLNVAAVDGLPETTKLKSTAAICETSEVTFKRTRPEISDTATRKSARSRWIMVGAGTGGALLLLFFVIILLRGSGTKSIAKPSVETRLPASDTSLKTNTPKPSPSTPLTAIQPAAVTEMQPDMSSQPADEEGKIAPPPVNAQMMNDQLNSPTRIPRDIKTKAVETAPPEGFGAAATEGLGPSLPVGGILPGQAHPMVKAAPAGAITISAGVATGLLIQKTQPVYPMIARNAHVGGIVEMQARISKIGTIQDLRVVRGPAMLRQAALEAVRTWRYTPYKLNNEPIEVETTISINFSLGG